MKKTLFIVSVLIIAIVLAVFFGRDKYNIHETIENDLNGGNLYCLFGNEWKLIERNRIKFKHVTTGKYVIVGASVDTCKVRN